LSRRPNSSEYYSAHRAEQIINVVTVETSDQPAAVAVALAVVSEALKCPAASPSR
jgi:hypothetical protein